MPRIPVTLALLALISAAVAGAFALYRRRTSPVLAYEVHPPMPETMTASNEALDQQIPDYYGGERLGQREGLQHFAAPS